MSHPSERFRQEPDRPDVARAVVIGLLSLAVFGFGVLAFYGILRYESDNLPPRSAPLAGQDEIGIVNQPLFDNDLRLQSRQARDRARLESYGWIDREKKLVHIPIRRAMERITLDQESSP